MVKYDTSEGKFEETIISGQNDQAPFRQIYTEPVDNKITGAGYGYQRVIGIDIGSKYIKIAFVKKGRKSMRS